MHTDDIETGTLFALMVMEVRHGNLSDHGNLDNAIICSRRCRIRTIFLIFSTVGLLFIIVNCWRHCFRFRFFHKFQVIFNVIYQRVYISVQLQTFWTTNFSNKLSLFQLFQLFQFYKQCTHGKFWLISDRFRMNS